MKKRFWKKATAVGVIAATAATMTSGSIVSAKDKMPVVNVVVAAMGAVDDSPEVEAAMNEILEAEIGAQMKLTWIDAGAYIQQTNLMLTGGDDIDIFWILGTPGSFIANEQVLDLTDYYENSSDEMKALFADYAIDAAKFDGRLYTIPSVIERSHELCLEVSKEMYAEMGYEDPDDSKIWTWDEIHDLLLNVKETFPDTIPVMPQAGSQIIQGYTWEGMGDTNYIGVVEDYGTTGAVISLTDCQDFIDLAHTMRQWYEEGLIMQDVLSNTNFAEEMIKSKKAFSFFEFGCQPDGMDENGIYHPLTIVPNWVDSTCGTRMGFAINGNTKNPDVSWQVLEQLYTNDELRKLYSYGIEGKHYVLNEEGKAAYPEGVTEDTTGYRFIADFVMPATRACSVQEYRYPFENHTATDRQYDQAAVDAGRISGTLGVMFDNTKVANAYTSCYAVWEKYYNAILSGAVDPDENIAAFKEELSAAGEDEIIAEKQRLLDTLSE